MNNFSEEVKKNNDFINEVEKQMSDKGFIVSRDGNGIDFLKRTGFFCFRFHMGYPRTIRNDKDYSKPWARYFDNSWVFDVDCGTADTSYNPIYEEELCLKFDDGYDDIKDFCDRLDNLYKRVIRESNLVE